MSNKIKVLWLSGAYFTDKKPDATGTWLHSMANELLKSGEIDLYNITQSNTSETKREDYLSIGQWLIPVSKLNKKGLPKKNIIGDIQQIISEVRPDIIHVWGTETYWGLLTARNIIKGKALLEIQGLKFEIEKYFYSGMSAKELVSSIGLRELIKPSDSIFRQKAAFKKWGQFEKEIIKNHQLITTQSNWVRSHVREINEKARLFKTKMVLRDEFVYADKWIYENITPYTIFTTFSSIVSYKGLHVLLRAISVLKKEFPDIKLIIGGDVGRKGIFGYGYLKWIQKEINRLDIEGNTVWAGPLKAEEIVNYLQSSHVAVISSFVESYCMALDEALHVGTPTVASFAGAMPELGKHKETVYYYQPNDHVLCADAIRSYLTDKEFAEKISLNAYNSKREKISTADIQIDIYKEVLKFVED